MTIDIPEQYQSLKTKLETIVNKTIIGETIRLVDGYGIIWSVNTTTGVSMITYNNTQTINANSYVTIKNPYDEGHTNIKYCPTTSVYAPTNLSSIYVHITWMGEIRLYNRSSSNVTSSTIQFGVSFVGKDYR